jgi:hypothetical protein
MRSTLTVFFFALLLLCQIPGDLYAQAIYEQKKITLPYDDHLLGADGHPTYIDDAAIHAAVPRLQNAGPRLSQCHTGMTIPEYLTVVYPPTVIAAHKATTRLFVCTHNKNDDHLECESDASASEVYFDNDPDIYFGLGHGTTIDQALPLMRAVEIGDLKFSSGVVDPHLTKRKGLVGEIEQSNGGFQIHYGDCGCRGTMVIKPDANSSDFLVKKAGFDMCV